MPYVCCCRHTSETAVMTRTKGNIRPSAGVLNWSHFNHQHASTIPPTTTSQTKALPHPLPIIRIGASPVAQTSPRTSSAPCPYLVPPSYTVILPLARSPLPSYNNDPRAIRTTHMNTTSQPHMRTSANVDRTALMRLRNPPGQPPSTGLQEIRVVLPWGIVTCGPRTLLSCRWASAVRCGLPPWHR